MSKKRWKPYVVMVKAMENKPKGQGEHKTVQVEVKANSDGHARHKAIELIRTAYPHINGFMVLALSRIDKDGRLEDNGVLDYKPTEMLADGDIAKINPGSSSSSSSSSSSTKPDQKALILPDQKDKAPSAKPRAGRKTSKAPVRTYGRLAAPFTTEVLKLCAEKKEVITYDSDNRPDGKVEFTKAVATGGK